MESPSSVLIVNVSRIGDTLFAVPAIRAIAAHWPNAKVTALGHPGRVEVLDNLPYVSRVMAITKKSAPWRGRFSSKQYDYAFVYGFDEALVHYALRGAARVIAFRQRNTDINHQLYRVVNLPPPLSEHAVLQALRLPAAVNIAPCGLRIGYQVTASETAWATAHLCAGGFDSAAPMIGLQVASFPTKAYRDWPIESFFDLCERIAQHWPKAGFLIFGGTEEKQRTAWLKEKLGNRAYLLAGKLTLRQTAAMMSMTDAYIGVDTGPTHIMSSFDIPLIGLFHCISPSSLTGPLEHPMNYCIDHPRSNGTCSEQMSMAEISVETVYSQVEKALAARGLRQDV